MNYEVHNNTSRNLIFRKNVEGNSAGYCDAEVTEHGYITCIRIRFAAGENGTLRLRPVMLLPGNIMLDLFKYADGCDHYISGDDETISNQLKMETENHSIIRIYYENIGEGTSQLNADVEVTYLRIVEPVNIIG